MILHALTPQPKDIPAMNWWAVHAETLTAVHVEILPGPVANLRVVNPAQPVGVELYRSAPSRNERPEQIAPLIVEEIRRNFFAGIKAGSITLQTAAEAALPEYLIVFVADGEKPAVFRTEFPRMIVPVCPGDESSLSFEASHWTVNKDLSGEGWAYFLDGCQHALDELAPALVAAEIKVVDGGCPD